jgi:hypothetical protein
MTVPIGHAPAVSAVAAGWAVVAVAAAGVVPVAALAAGVEVFVLVEDGVLYVEVALLARLLFAALAVLLRDPAAARAFLTRGLEFDTAGASIRMTARIAAAMRLRPDFPLAVI